MPIKQGEKIFQTFEECENANRDKQSPGGLCKTLEDKQQNSGSLDNFRIKSLNAKLSMIGIRSNLKKNDESELALDLKDDLEVPDIDDLTQRLVTKKKPKFAKLPNNSRLFLASLESTFDNGRFASYFLLTGDMVNGRGWGVTAESIPRNIKSFIGKPFVITSNEFIANSPYGETYDHPSTEHLPLLGLAKAGTYNVDDESLIGNFQNKFRVGKIVDIFEKEGLWRAIIQKDAKFANRSFPAFCSPSILNDNPFAPEGQLDEWHGLHLAGLNEKPAYGSIAIKKGECAGPLGHCVSQLKSASMGKLFRNAKSSIPTFAGFADIRECVEANKGIEKDPKTYCFAHVEGITKEDNNDNKFPPCKIRGTKDAIRNAHQKIGALMSESNPQTNKLNVLGDFPNKKKRKKKKKAKKTY